MSYVSQVKTAHFLACLSLFPGKRFSRSINCSVYDGAFAGGVVFGALARGVVLCIIHTFLTGKTIISKR